MSRPDDSGVVARVDALRSALSEAGDVLGPESTAPAERVFQHASERLSLSAEHTVVVLAGATGSGKSSLFNRLVGLDLAQTGVIRPTTASPLACAWGPAGATALLDWIGIAPRDQIARRSVLDAPRDDEFEGLVLIDLPDHDSVVQEHQDIVDHVAGYADLFVWVLDPQKYADRAIHDRYLGPLSTHRTATMVVMNQADRLSDTDLKVAIDDLERILEEEGLTDLQVIATSARTGAGLAGLRAEIARRIRTKDSAQERLSADVRQVARALAAEAGTDPAPGIDRGSRDRLVETFVECAGVPQIADAVEHSVARRAVVATDWPLIGWVGRLRHDPLRELASGRSARDAVAADIPVAPSVQRARADVALRELTDEATAGLSRSWRASIAESVHGRGTRDVIDELDDAVAAVDLRVGRRRWWWSAVGLVQWVTLIALVAGLAWSAAAVAGLVEPDPWEPAPRVLGLSLPALLVVGGLLTGVILTVLSRWWGSVSARRAGARAEADLREAIGRTTESEVMGRLRDQLERYERWRTGLATAGA